MLITVAKNFIRAVAARVGGIVSAILAPSTRKAIEQASMRHSNRGIHQFARTWA